MDTIAVAAVAVTAISLALVHIKDMHRTEWLRRRIGAR